MRIASPGQVLRRGIYLAPWMGEHGEIVLLAITSRQRLAAPPYMIPHGADRVAASDAMWEALDRMDPDHGTMLRAI